MTTTKRNLVVGVGVAMAFAAGFMAHSRDAEALTPSQQCPHIAAAITALNDAKIDLNNAQNTFAGHKTSALEAIATATSQLNDCLAMCVPPKTKPGTKTEP